jgi:hypothetical protein
LFCRSLAPDFDKWIDNFLELRAKDDNYRGALTVIVGCGIGRAAYHTLSEKRRHGWRAIYLSAPEISSLSDLDETDAKTLWRILDEEERLREHNVELINLNGMLGLVAWMRSLDGHLINHGQIPSDLEANETCHLMIDPSIVRELRQEIAQKLDRHAVLSPRGRWVVVRKINDSDFAEYRAAPLYGSTEWRGDDYLAMVYESTNRRWWCCVKTPREYRRWKLMTTWLPRIAAVMDAEVPSLPELISLQIAYNAYNENLPKGEVVRSRGEIETEIQVSAHPSDSEITVTTERLFEEGLAQPDNVS